MSQEADSTFAAVSNVFRMVLANHWELQSFQWFTQNMLALSTLFSCSSVVCTFLWWMEQRNIALLCSTHLFAQESWSQFVMHRRQSVPFESTIIWKNATVVLDDNIDWNLIIIITVKRTEGSRLCVAIEIIVGEWQTVNHPFPPILENRWKRQTELFDFTWYHSEALNSSSTDCINPSVVGATGSVRVGILKAKPKPCIYIISDAMFSRCRLRQRIKTRIMKTARQHDDALSCCLQREIVHGHYSHTDFHAPSKSALCQELVVVSICIITRRITSRLEYCRENESFHTILN